MGMFIGKKLEKKAIKSISFPKYVNGIILRKLLFAPTKQAATVCSDIALRLFT